MDSVRHAVTDITAAETRLLKEREALEARQARLGIIMAGLGTVAGVLLVVFQGGLLARAVDAEERLSAELAERARQLEESAAELEMTNEELHLANEQQQYTVEELQTATEELETSNEQLHVANDDLVRSRDDLAARQVALRASEEQFRTLAQHLPVSLPCRSSSAAPTGQRCT